MRRLLKVLLIRHGATKANIDKRFQGRLDYPLCEQGEIQANLLAERLKETDVSMIYTSNLRRAKSTADKIIKYHGDRLEILPELEEYSWGVIEGLTRKEIRFKYNELADKIEKDFWGTKIPGEEGILPFKNRLSKIYDFLIEKHTKENININPDEDMNSVETIVLVTHGRVIGGFLAYLTGYDLYNLPWPFVISNASLTEVDFFYYNNSYMARIVLLNDCCHIKDIRDGNSY